MSDKGPERGAVYRRAGSPGTPERRAEILAAAFAVLAEKGYKGASTLAIARRARTSKETIYNWFGSKQGLFEALVAATAEAMYAGLSDAMNRDDLPPEEVLYRLGVSFLTVGSGTEAVTITRAAISEAHTSPEFGRLLFANGPRVLLGLLTVFLERRRDDGALAFDDTADAIQTFIGLLMGVRQIDRLIGMAPPPSTEEIDRCARRAADLFLRLHAAPPAR